jgi:MFS family permease
MLMARHSLPCLPTPLPCTVGFISRPVGALLFGHMGDTRGRGTCLLVSVILMGVPTVSGGPYRLLGCYKGAGVSLKLLTHTVVGNHTTWLAGDTCIRGYTYREAHKA